MLVNFKRYTQFSLKTLLACAPVVWTYHWSW